MSHHYIRNHYGDNCYFRDNSWKRMQRYNESHGDTLIFNYGCGSSCCCNTGYYGGGLSCGNFWSGFGTGIGLGIANFFGGIMGGFCGMPFWGGMFSMPTFGMTGFGGSSVFTNYGMVPDYVGMFTPRLTTNTGSGSTSGAGSTSSTGNTGSTGGTGNVGGSNGTEGTAKSGTDELIDKANELKEDATPDDIQKVLDEINAKLAEEGLSETDKDKLEKAKTKLEAQKIIAGIDATDPKPLSTQDTETLLKALKELDDFNLTDEQKNKVKSALGKDLDSLKDNTNTLSNHVCYQCSKDYDKLKKLELLTELGEKVCVNVEYYANGIDKWIRGPISNVKKNDDDSITYEVDCKETGKEGFKATWTMEQKTTNGKTELRPIESDYDGTWDKTVHYEWNGSKGHWENNTQRATAKAKSKK